MYPGGAMNAAAVAAAAARHPGPQPGQPFKLSIQDSCERIKEEFNFLQAQYHNLKLECEKLASEKIEIQRHYVMLHLIAYFHYPSKNRMNRVTGWMRDILHRTATSEEEYGVLAALTISANEPRSLMGPLPFVVRLPECITVKICSWISNLGALNGKREQLFDFFRRFIPDLELTDSERDFLYRNVQSARRKAHPSFKWKSEVLRQLRNYQRIPAHRLYRWARQGMENGWKVPLLDEIVTEMKRLNVEDGPYMVNIEEFRNVGGQGKSPKAKDMAPQSQDLQAKVAPKILEVQEAYRRMDPKRFLEFLLDKFPPRTSGEIKGSSNEPLHKSLRKAIFHYHPDKQMDQDLEWKLLCDEIAKLLCAKFESVK